MSDGNDRNWYFVIFVTHQDFRAEIMQVNVEVELEQLEQLHDLRFLRAFKTF